MAQKLPVVIISCRVFQNLLDNLIDEYLIDQIIYLDYGLHQVPKKLTTTLQSEINKIKTPSLVVLGYGLCGNGLDGIESGQHSLLMPRTDDCIAILLGSYAEYREEFSTQPGTYYLTKGWLESGSNPLQEYQGYVEKYGSKRAEWLMDVQYKNYKRLLFVAHSQDELDDYQPKVAEIAHFCNRWNMHSETRIGSDQYLRRLIQTVEEFQADGFSNIAQDVLNDFVLVPPGSKIEQKKFFRK